jgi:guanylate kinase
MTMKGPLIVVSGPSGSGKSTVIARTLKETADLPLYLAVSATTRQKRKGEHDGVHYFFWDRGRFLDEVSRGAFLEYFEVHGNYYGTLRREVEPNREQGKGVVLEIDVQGAAEVRKHFPDAVSVFIRAASIAVYEQRLRDRGTEDEERIQRRLAKARQEEERIGEFNHVILNDDLDRAVTELQTIIRGLFKGFRPCSTS